MSFRFHRTVRLFPGLRVNVSKSGVSASIGTRGAWLTFGRKGTRTTVGLPGTGVSYTQTTPAHEHRTPALRPAEPRAAGPSWYSCCSQSPPSWDGSSAWRCGRDVKAVRQPEPTGRGQCCRWVTAHSVVTDPRRCARRPSSLEFAVISRPGACCGQSCHGAYGRSDDRTKEPRRTRVHHQGITLRSATVGLRN